MNVFSPGWITSILVLFGLAVSSFVVVFYAPSVQASPWDQTYSATCFNRWIYTAVSRLNSYNGSAAWNRNKPYRINRYGLWHGRSSYSNYAPDRFHLYKNRYHWMWDHYPYSAYSGWRVKEWNYARVPALRSYVLRCLKQYAPRVRTPTVRTPTVTRHPPRVRTPVRYVYYHQPKYGGYHRLDRCYYWGKYCNGWYAANAWCKWAGFRGVYTYRLQNNIGATRIIGSNQVCSHRGCDGFAWIRCRR